MNLMQAIQGRRAVRDYRSDPVPHAAIRQLMNAASWAPSSLDSQPWHFTVICDPALLRRISGAAKAWLLQNAQDMPREAHFRDLLTDPHFNLFYNAPALIVISTLAAGQWSREDCTAAAQNLMLAAVPLELGTCWIGLAQPWLNSAEGKARLNIPSQAQVIAPIALGYPKAMPPAASRKPLAVNWLQHQDAADAMALH